MKKTGPWRQVVSLSEKLQCGHHVPLKLTYQRSGRFLLHVHKRRRCADCEHAVDTATLTPEEMVARLNERVPPELIEKLQAQVQRLEGMLAQREGATA